jgi:SAM-dependent methyltransferase
MTSAGNARTRPINAIALAELVAAYDGVDDLRAFPNDDALARYRRGLLRRSREQVAFLLPFLPPRARVVEVGCGNGRLLVGLAETATLSEGMGIDLSRTRIDFARRWAADEQLSSLRFEVGDIRALELPAGRYDAALCLTGAFAYFEPIAAGSAAVLVRRLGEALVESGLLCLELYPHPRARRLINATGGEARVWSELPPEDPWRFYLSRLSLNASGKVMSHEKTFVHRTSGEIDSGRREHLYLYKPAEVEDLLRRGGFDEVRLHEGWTDAPYQGGEVLVVSARRPA